MNEDNPFDAPGEAKPAGAPSLAFSLGDRDPAPLTVGGILSRCWELVLDRPIEVVGTLAILFLVSVITAIPSTALDIMGGFADNENEAVLMSGASAIFSILAQLVTFFFTLGAVRVFSQVAGGGDASLSMLVGEGRRYLPGIAAMILQIIAIVLGLILLIVPGVIVGLGLQFTLYAMVHQRMGPIEALQESWSLTDGHKLNIFLINLVIFIGAMIVICCTMGMGLIIVWPVLSLTQGVMYHTLLHERELRRSMSAAY